MGNQDVWGTFFLFLGAAEVAMVPTSPASVAAEASAGTSGEVFCGFASDFTFALGSEGSRWPEFGFGVASAFTFS